MSPLPTRVLLDVDTGIDDALAIIFATAEPRLDVVGVSAVVGNVAVATAARNSAAVLSAVGRPHIPVVIGAGVTASARGPRVGPTNHGVDGLGGVPIPSPAVPLPAVPSPAAPSSAALPDADTDPLALLRRLSSHQPVSVAACAPLTNVARYASQPGVERIVLVGGELLLEEEPEFNVAHDPVSAATTMGADVPITVFPIDVFETVCVPAATVARLRVSDSPAARLAGALLAVRRAHLLGDAGALVLMAAPELFEIERHRMAVVGGRLVLDADGGREVDVVVGADGPAVVEHFVAAVAGASPNPS